MATITSIDNREVREPRGLFLPQWFLVAIAGAFLSVSATVIGIGIGTWRDVGEATRINNEQTAHLQRLDTQVQALEGLYADVATIKSRVDTTSQDTLYIRTQLDIMRNTFEDRGRNR